MKIVKNCAFSVSLFALAIGLAASQANAQTLKGTFNLPFEAHWGRTVLQPGEYRVSFPEPASTLPVIYLTSQGKTVMVLIGSSRVIPESERSYLRVENVGEAHVVREFNLGVTGKQLIFPVANSVKSEESIARNEQATTIPVSASGGN